MTEVECDSEGSTTRVIMRSPARSSALTPAGTLRALTRSAQLRDLEMRMRELIAPP
jgi:hypothetical protein